jgi:tRNA pseudouridine55 synthase
MKDGVIIIDKPCGMTSFDAVARIRRLFGTRQVGHTGTLDPMATGVLVVMVGRAVKASEYLTLHDKSYEAILKLGITTDTEDTTGNILSSSNNIPTFDEVKEVCKGFVGNIIQIPPMYSALKKEDMP